MYINQDFNIDNDEYFKRKATFTDEEGALYADNDERAIFFAKGVVETVKKLNWVPDIIHVHGWMASMLPVYMKHFYKDEALFSETKIISSIYQCMSSVDLIINKTKTDSFEAIKRRVSDLMIYITQVITIFNKFKKSIIV